MADEYVQTHTRKVADVMTPEPYTITESTSLEEVVQLMEKHRIKRLPVVRDTQLVGIVSRANLLHALASLAPAAPATAPSDEAIRRGLLAELEQQKWAPVGFLNVIVRMVSWIFGARSPTSASAKPSSSPPRTSGVKDVQDHLVWVDPTSGVVIGAKGEVVTA